MRRTYKSEIIMSKMVRLLNKVATAQITEKVEKAEKVEKIFIQPRVKIQEEQTLFLTTKPDKKMIGLVIFVMIVALVSALLSFYSLRTVTKAADSSSYLLTSINAQQAQLRELSDALKVQQQRAINQSKMIEEIVNQQKETAVLISELKVNDRLLVEKIMANNTEVKMLKLRTQEQLRRLTETTNRLEQSAVGLGGVE